MICIYYINAIGYQDTDSKQSKKPAGAFQENYFIWICGFCAANEVLNEFPFLFNCKKKKKKPSTNV